MHCALGNPYTCICRYIIAAVFSLHGLCIFIPFFQKLIKSFEEDAIPVHYMSTLTETGVMEVRNEVSSTLRKFGSITVESSSIKNF